LVAAVNWRVSLSVAVIFDSKIFCTTERPNLHERGIQLQPHQVGCAS
jgi:hypothetical protein